MRKTAETDAFSQALAEPSRRALLEHLRSGRKTVGEMVTATGLKQPNVSNHLAKMREQGLVRAERAGRQVYYTLAMPFAESLLQMHEMAAHSRPAALSSPTAGASHDRNGENGHTSSAAHNGQHDADTLTATRSAFLEVLMAGDEERAAHAVNGMLARHWRMETIYGDVFAPCVNHIGDLYQRGETDIANEHMASALIERMMARVSQFYAPVTRSQRRAVLGCVADNWHVLGPRMLADALRERGWEIYFLGANVPTASFENMARAVKPDLILLSCAMQDQWDEVRAATDALHRLRRDENLAFQLTAGGHFLHEHPDALDQLHIDFSAATLDEFIEKVQAHFHN